MVLMAAGTPEISIVFYSRKYYFYLRFQSDLTLYI